PGVSAPKTGADFFAQTGSTVCRYIAAGILSRGAYPRGSASCTKRLLFLHRQCVFSCSGGRMFTWLFHRRCFSAQQDGWSQRSSGRHLYFMCKICNRTRRLVWACCEQVCLRALCIGSKRLLTNTPHASPGSAGKLSMHFAAKACRTAG